MKISKLFHWLYAILMLLPFAFFVPSVLYYAFNDNATMQSVEVPKTETIGVNFNQKFSEDDYTTFDSYGLVATQYGESVEVVGTNNNTSRVQWWFSATISINKDHIYYFDYYATGSEYSSMSKAIVLTREDTSRAYYTLPVRSNGFVGYRFYTQNDGTIHNYDFTYQLMVFDLTQMFGVGNEPTIEEFNNYFPNSYYPYNESELMQITYDTGETEQLVENTSIINYAWESIWDLPLFSWTKVTFVSVPFSYLTAIFGIGASNSLNYVFGYFVTISIVWLVFDLLLYVPMLAHNWIDKARIE